MNEPSFFSDKSPAIYESGNGDLNNTAPNDVDLESTIAAAADVASAVGPTCLWDSSIWAPHSGVHEPPDIPPLSTRSSLNHTIRKHSAYIPPNSALLPPHSRVSKLSTGSAGIPGSSNALAQQRKPRRYSAACLVQRNLSCFDLKDVTIAELTRSLVVQHESYAPNENDHPVPVHSTRSSQHHPPHILLSEREHVELWLDSHPEFLYEYLSRKVPRKLFEQWVQYQSRNSRSDGSSCRHSAALDGQTDATTATPTVASRRNTTNSRDAPAHRSPDKYPNGSVNVNVASNSRTGSGSVTPARKSSKNALLNDNDPSAPAVKQLVTSDADGFPAAATRFAESDLLAHSQESCSYSSGAGANSEQLDVDVEVDTSNCIPLLIAPSHDTSGNEMQMQVIEEQSTASPSSSSLSVSALPIAFAPSAAGPTLEPQGLLYELVLDICNDLDASSLYDKILHNLCVLLSAERCVLFLVQRSELTGERVLVARTRPRASDPPSSVQSPSSPVASRPNGDGELQSKSGPGAGMGSSDSDSSTLSESGDPPPLPPPASLASLVEVPFGIGILGTVAATGCTVNLSDVSESQESGFDPALDELEPDVWLYLPHASTSASASFPSAGGAATPAAAGALAERPPVRSLLCTPIKNGVGQVVGVCELVNKRPSGGGPVTAFGSEDERLLAAYSIFCGLCIHHTKMYERAIRAIAKQRVALEVLSYHAVAPIEEALRLRVCRTLNTDDFFSSLLSSHFYVLCSTVHVRVLYSHS